MEHVTCNEVQMWVQQIIGSRDPRATPPRIAAHIATCPMCRGAIATMVIAALQLDNVPAALTCDRCEDDLAAFIDLEMEQGSMAAARRFPALLWHLWTCADCAEVYELTRRVIQAEQPAMNSDSVGRHLIRLVRSFLRVALPALSPRLGTARGSANNDVVLALQEDEEPQFTVGARRVGNGLWRLTVTVDPPPRGQLRLSLGETQFRARFNAQGVAVVSDVPDILLTADDGPDLDIALEE